MASDIPVPEKFNGISAKTANIVFQDKQKHVTRRFNAKWRHLPQIPARGIDKGMCVIQTADGGYCITGQTSGLSRDMWLIKTHVESGLAWTDSTSDTITLYRGATDPYWNYVRVRIWEMCD